jgi:nucleoside-diphosphate-sugar epimerase
MKILVTGVAGFIGSHLAERLISRGHQVVGLDCYTDYYAKWLKQLNARVVESAGAAMLSLDLAKDDLDEAVRDVEVVFHCAAQPGISARTNFETYVRNNVTATYRLLEAVRGVESLQCFVNIATSSIYGAQATEAEDAVPQPTYGRDGAEADIILWRDKAGGGATGNGVLPPVEDACVFAEALFRIRSAREAGKALSQAHRQHIVR